ncbi:MAG: hypothetical protein ACJ8AT_09175 [Hyalangium sp.]|uniref:hypothetical protein n=1 Tax=Hyalangium sp. TaxID=2028555 RepID=UPI003899D94B
MEAVTPETATPNEQATALEQLQTLCTQMRQLLAAGNVNCHQIGVLYNIAVKEKLAEKAKLKTASAYFSKHIKELSKATLVRYGAVAKEFSEEACVQYGVTALSLLLTYAEASKTEVDTNELSTVVIAVPDQNGVVDEKFFGECTVVDLRKALERLRRPTSSAPLSADILARIEQCRTVWMGYFPEQAGVELVARNRKGKASVSLKDIPLEVWEQLTALLGRSLQASRIN